MRRLLYAGALLAMLVSADLATAQVSGGIRIGGGGPYWGGYGGYGGSVRIGGTSAYYGNWGTPYGYGYNRGWGGYYGGSRYYYGSPGYYYTRPSIVLGPSVAAPVAMPVHMTVMVPNYDAEVFVNDAATTSKGTERLFESRPLTPGVPYTYTLKARWMEDGKMVERTREFSVEPGGTFMIDFRQPEN